MSYFSQLFSGNRSTHSWFAVVAAADKAREKKRPLGAPAFNHAALLTQARARIRTDLSEAAVADLVRVYAEVGAADAIANEFRSMIDQQHAETLAAKHDLFFAAIEETEKSLAAAREKILASDRERSAEFGVECVSSGPLDALDRKLKQLSQARASIAHNAGSAYSELRTVVGEDAPQ